MRQSLIFISTSSLWLVPLLVKEVTDFFNLRMVPPQVKRPCSAKLLANVNAVQLLWLARPTYHIYLQSYTIHRLYQCIEMIYTCLLVLACKWFNNPLVNKRIGKFLQKLYRCQQAPIFQSIHTLNFPIQSYNYLYNFNPRVRFFFKSHPSRIVLKGKSWLRRPKHFYML